MEAHQHCDSDGYVSISRKVRIDLQRIRKQGHKVLESREQQWVAKYPVHEVHRDVIAQDYLLYQTVEYPEHRQPEHPAAQAELALELREEFACANNWTGDQLWEETDVESEVEYVAQRFDVAAVNVCRIAYYLENEERDADREDYPVNAEALSPCEGVAYDSKYVDDLQFSAQQITDDVRKEIGVFEPAEQPQVNADAENQPGLAPPPFAPRYPVSYQEVRTDDEKQYEYGKAAGLVVEEKADKKQICISQMSPVADEGKSGIHQREERPEIELGEKQW